MSSITIKAIHESSHSSIPILLNISLNHSKFYLIEVLINTLYTLTQTLHSLIQVSIIVARHKSPPHKEFYLIPSINPPLIIPLVVYH